MPGERELANEAVAKVRSRREGLERLLALGLCAIYKRDRIARDEEMGGGVIDPVRQAELAESFTEREINDYKQNASRALDEYVRECMQGLHPTSWWYGFFQGIAAAFAYSLLLVAFALLFRFFGSDLTTVFRFVFGSA